MRGSGHLVGEPRDIRQRWVVMKASRISGHNQSYCMAFTSCSVSSFVRIDTDSPPRRAQAHEGSEDERPPAQA